MYLFKLEMVACLLICLYFRQALAAKEFRNIFNQIDFDLKTQDDDATDRHPGGRPTYDADNPPPTARPSMRPSMMPSAVPTFLPTGMPSSTPSNYPSTLPSSSPSFVPSAHPSIMPSVFTCKIDSNGDFGNTTDNFKERVTFRYEVELNKTLLQTDSDAYINEIEKDILPLVEDLMVLLLFPYLFAECTDGEFNSTSTFPSIEGVSKMPEDLLNIDLECKPKKSADNFCFPIDSEFSLFYKSRRRLSEDRDENKLKEIVKSLMADGHLNDAHPAIVGMTYAENNAQPIIENRGQLISELNNDGERSSSILPIALGVGGFGLLVVIMSLIWRKRKARGDNQLDESSSIPAL